MGVGIGHSPGVIQSSTILDAEVAQLHWESLASGGALHGVLQVAMPAAGSDGAGEQAQFEVLYTAVLQSFPAPARAQQESFLSHSD